MNAVVWVSAAVLLIVLEMFGAGFFLACIAIGCLFGAAVSALSGSVAVSVAVAAIASLLALIFVRPFAKSRLMSGTDKATNIDAIIGKAVEVVEAIPVNGKGRIKQDGDTWPAIDAAGKAHNAGEMLKIVARSGGTVIVE